MEARMRIVLATLLIAASSSLAVAQSSTATSGTVKPMTTAPASNTLPNGQPKYVAPPAARSGERGLHVGEGAMDAGPVEIKRVK
jgi:hypothetical protein